MPRPHFPLFELKVDWKKWRVTSPTVMLRLRSLFLQP
jgi:hypothetical protein